MQPSPYYFKVIPTPTDPNERQQKSGLYVVGDPDGTKIYSGVVEDMGNSMPNDEWTVEIGNVLFYLKFVVVGDYHFVLAEWTNVLGWE